MTAASDELYATPPHAFTAARDAHVAQARADGDRGRATALASLKRPTVGAWLVNLLVLRRPDTVRDLIELGATIRTAQGQVGAAELRELSRQRQRDIDAAADVAARLATQAGEPAPNRAQLAEVTSTLAAAMADEAAAAEVVGARLLKSLTYGGFGFGEGLGATAATTSTSARPPSRPQKATSPTARRAAPVVDDQAEAERASALAAAQTRASQAADALAAAVDAEEQAVAHTARLTSDLEALRAQLDAAERDQRSARQARLAAERDAASAQRRLDRLNPDQR